MKRGWMWAALVAGLSLWPLGAQAAGAYAMVTGTILVPAINDTITSQNALNVPQLAGIQPGLAWTADSTAWFGVGQFNHVVIWVRVIPAATGDTTNTATLAILAKCRMWDGATNAADSLSGSFSVPEIAGAILPAQPPAGSGTGVWPGEFIKTIDPYMGRSPASGKSNRYFGPSTYVYDIASETGQARIACGLMQIRVRMLNYNSTVTKKARVQLWVMGFN